MTKGVALIHTSFALLGPERMLFAIFDEILPGLRLINIVDDGMLRQVREQGDITPSVTRRMCYYVLAAEAMGVDAVFSTCSSLGPAITVARELVSIPVVKIDDAMAEKAVRSGRRIGVMATVPTTLGPTIDLIHEKAAAQGEAVDTRRVLSEGAFDRLMDGDVQGHDDMVASSATATAQWADTIVLAQCTMARLAPRLSLETGLPVLSSPRLGVEHLKQVLGK